MPTKVRKFRINLGEPVVVSFSGNHAKLYDFGFYTSSGSHAILYRHGHRNMKNSISVEKARVKRATKHDLATLNWD